MRRLLLLLLALLYIADVRVARAEDAAVTGPPLAVLADAVADAIRWPVIEPDRDVRGFQSVLCELGAKLDLPGFVNEDGSQKYADYGDYIVSHERKPGIGPLAGFRGDGSDAGRGAPNPKQLERYIENGGFFVEHVPEGANYYKPWNSAYQDWAVKMGIIDSPQPYLFQLYVEPMRKFQRAAEGHGDRQPPEHLRDRIKETLDPLPIWYAPAEDSYIDLTEYPIHALTQRPMAMYHSWGTQNAWLRQIHGMNPLYVPSNLMQEHNLVDGEWIRTDHISYQNAVSNGIAAGAFTQLSFISVSGYDEPLLVRAESTSDGNYETVKKLDSNCRWWDRPVITLCGVNRIAANITDSGSMNMVYQSLYNDNPWPCEPSGSIPIQWNPEFQMIEPAVSGANWCAAYVPDAEVEYPLAPCVVGDRVTAIQNGLAAAGFNVDTDGYFGIGTMRTVMRYQQRQGLDITGVVSEELAVQLTAGNSGDGD